MKMSTKIIVIAVVVWVGSLLGSYLYAFVRYYKMRPMGIEMHKKLSESQIHHFVLEFPRHNSWELKSSDEGVNPYEVIFERNNGYKRFEFGSNLKRSYIRNDTLYVKALRNDLFLFSTPRHSSVNIPELTTYTVITKDTVVRRRWSDNDIRER